MLGVESEREKGDNCESSHGARERVYNGGEGQARQAWHHHATWVGQVAGTFGVSYYVRLIIIVLVIKDQAIWDPHTHHIIFYYYAA